MLKLFKIKLNNDLTAVFIIVILCGLTFPLSFAEGSSQLYNLISFLTLLVLSTILILCIYQLVIFDVSCQSNKSVINLYLLSSCLMVSSISLLAFYPALMSDDSIVHWLQAALNRYETWQPPIMAFLMDINFVFSKQSPAFITLLQSFLFWYSISLVLSKFIKSGRTLVILSVLIFLVPTLWTYSVTVWKDVWFTSISLLSASFLIDFSKSKSFKFYLISLLLISLAITFRHNSYPVILLHLVYMLTHSLQSPFFRNRRKRKTIAAMLIILFLGYTPSKLLSSLPFVSQNSPTGWVLGSIYMGTLSRANLSLPEMEVVKTEIDSLYGNLTFEKTYNNYYITGYKCLPPFFELLSFHTPDDSRKLRILTSKTFKLVINHPYAYLRHRLCNLSYLFQVNEICLPYIVGISSNSLGLISTPKLTDLNRKIYEVLDFTLLPNSRFQWIWRTYIFLILSLSLSLFAYFVLKKDRDLMLLSILQVSYALSYFPTDSGCDWRFLLLSYVCSIISIVVVAKSLVLMLNKRFISMMKIL